ncbi:MAG: type II toxin-antitoxin system VapC family toxin [Actinobacteria bacterium]|nr:type II toxin-antitoxin system VapC family toxin [Actinomycetota bacterium]
MSWYVDSSAIVAVIFDEPEALALENILQSAPVTSRLSKVEVLRRVNKFDETLLPRAEKVLSQFQLVEMTESILVRAENYPPQITAKTADAIHLATAETLSPLIEGVLTLDKQMAKNAQKLNLTVY